MAEKFVIPIHGQDHCPGGPDPIPCLEIHWARVSKGFDASNQVIGNNSHDTLTVNHTYNMGAGENGEGYFEVFNNGLADTGIRILQSGFYAVTAEMAWFSSVGAAWQFGVDVFGADWLSDNTFAGTTSTDLHAVVSFFHRFDVDDVLEMTVWQITGGNRDVDACYLEVARLGSYTGTAWASMNPAK